ncbi:hypothetical protein [Sphingomonas flavalba]|uniref:hypothetical protein n=1 Tax=Sphingomonas flavalba TaxID=2559804 RepID=UPI00109E318B|nr:hypothetical protein [Sphingomonas flavalba]
MRLALMLPLLALAACQQTPSSGLDDSDRALNVGNAVDPALTAALEDQIMVDPDLAGASNRTSLKPGAPALRGAVPAPGGGGPGKVEPGAALSGPLMKAPPPSRTTAATRPMTIGQRAGRQAARSGGGCNGNVVYGASWATSLPSAFPIFPRGQLVEAAGSDTPRCRLRIVSFTTDAAPAALLDYYYTRARRAGFDAERVREGQADILGGTRGDDAYYLIVNPRAGGGADADLVVNNGR